VKELALREYHLVLEPTSNNQPAEKIINYKGISIYRIQNNKMVETWHVVDGLPSRGF
jgi:predicted SnoaL-like aldol condensation-catalyzing enzyme